MTEGDAGVRTLGERLDNAGRRLSARYRPSLPWARDLARVYARAAARAPHLDRYQRVEVDPDGMRPAPLAERRVVDPGNGLSGSHRAPQRPAGPAPLLTEGSGVALGKPVQVGQPDGSDGLERGRGVADHIRTRLRDIVGPAADVIQVHDDGPAHALARSNDADALTVGRDVYFRDGRYRPDQASGFALLMHEATHVQALLSPGAVERRGTRAGAADEEARALANEKAAGEAVRPAVVALPGPWIESHRLPSTRTESTMQAQLGPTSQAHGLPGRDGRSAPAMQPMKAAVDRISAPAPAPFDIEGLRRGLVNELKQLLRSEFDRGA